MNSLSTWVTDQEPNEANILSWMDGIFQKSQPIEQSRWNEAHRDALFYAGCQNFTSNNTGYGNYGNGNAYSNWYFNICQQPINLITGYQRQHRKNFNYTPIDGADTQTTDQYNSIITNVANRSGIHEQFSKGCEQSSITGLCIAQPYLDFMGEDPLQGDLKLKIWEFNSFIVDPYFREPDMSDANYIWFQEYISLDEAKRRFPKKSDEIMPFRGGNTRYGRFYFLPEQQQQQNNNLCVLSYIWYKSTRKRKRLFSESKQQFYDISTTADWAMITQTITDLQVVTVEVPTWKVCVVLNDKLMHQSENPLGFDRTPFVPIFWNYEPYLDMYELRSRGLIRTMRDPQYLFNLKVAQNNDIVSSIINSGWKRKEGAVVNEDNLKKTGGGWDIIINQANQMTDVEKIIPSALPQSDIELANQMEKLMYSTSGIQMENWAGQEDSQISTLTALMKQAANLMVFQKYFDQWDYAFKQIGDILLQIVLNNWNAEKVKLIINEEPSPFFYSKIFSKYDVIVEESVLTPTQRDLQVKQMMEFNQAFGREVFTASEIIEKMNIHGKSQILERIANQDMQQQIIQEQNQAISGAFQEAQLQKLHSDSVKNLAMGAERYGRAGSNEGLEQERISEILRNRALATRDKVEAIRILLESVDKYGELETKLAAQNVNQYNQSQIQEEKQEELDVENSIMKNEFVSNILKNQLEVQNKINTTMGDLSQQQEI